MSALAADLRPDQSCASPGTKPLSGQSRSAQTPTIAPGRMTTAAATSVVPLRRILPLSGAQVSEAALFRNGPVAGSDAVVAVAIRTVFQTTATGPALARSFRPSTDPREDLNSVWNHPRTRFEDSHVERPNPVPFGTGTAR
jgi:hypothetical protein